MNCNTGALWLESYHTMRKCRVHPLTRTAAWTIATLHLINKYFISIFRIQKTIEFNECRRTSINPKMEISINRRIYVIVIDCNLIRWMEWNTRIIILLRCYKKTKCIEAVHSAPRPHTHTHTHTDHRLRRRRQHYSWTIHLKTYLQNRK